MDLSNLKPILLFDLTIFHCDRRLHLKMHIPIFLLQNPDSHSVLSRSYPQLLSNTWGVNCLLLLMLFALLLGGCKEKEEVEAPDPIRPVKLHTVEVGMQELQMSLPGRVRAARRSELSFKVSGPLEELPIEEGQVVKKGDLIAQILKRDFETAITEAKARELEAEQQYNR